ncbi:hypothetical protein K505DRAFT_369389 [Melanomma pulvis-pyrius CBS 109.77]|uniref:Uncharacterized protein n=1 Tax=Melanomma pulvis-pyrius CBS 109.77 TaxID=1314802 RepID=A0A6A6WN11_9PLEO|nr:hypothetical protein K505DRAFT_369389 [Melanomma pulvis-pyrius CBS 109.77]
MAQLSGRRQVREAEESEKIPVEFGDEGVKANAPKSKAIIEIDGDEGLPWVPLGPRAGCIRCLAPISSNIALERPASKELVIAEDGFAMQPPEVRVEPIYCLAMHRRTDSGTAVSSDVETRPTFDSAAIGRSRLGRMQSCPMHSIVDSRASVFPRMTGFWNGLGDSSLGGVQWQQ